jgi:uncharacterized lipoprotein YajG
MYRRLLIALILFAGCETPETKYSYPPPMAPVSAASANPEAASPVPGDAQSLKPASQSYGTGSSLR